MTVAAGRQAAAGPDGTIPDELLSVADLTAMGCRGRIVTAGGPIDLAQRAAEQVADLERRWSRFRPTSEIAQLNRRAGQVTIVSEPTFELIRRAAMAMEATGGRFNPLLLDQLEALGYRRSWEGSLPPAGPAEVGPGCTEPIELLPAVSGVRLPPGTRFDPGGIGKGLAVDRITRWCLDQGATTVCADLGGDLRVAGRPWYGPVWRIGVEHPFHEGREIGSFTPGSDAPDAIGAGGAVTTSTTLYRVWDGPEGRRHHLLDPATGRPAATDLVSVTTCSSEAWWAEVAAKAVLLSGAAAAPGLLARLGTPGLAVAASGEVVTSGSASPTMTPAGPAGPTPPASDTTSGPTSDRTAA